MPTKVAKKLPKRTTNAHARDYRAKAWKSGQERKAERRSVQDKQHRANVAAGKEPKRRIRPRLERLCLRCEMRRIPVGSTCWCRSIGAERRK